MKLRALFLYGALAAVPLWWAAAARWWKLRPADRRRQAELQRKERAPHGVRSRFSRILVDPPVRLPIGRLDLAPAGHLGGNRQW